MQLCYSEVIPFEVPRGSWRRGLGLNLREIQITDSRLGIDVVKVMSGYRAELNTRCN